MITNPELRLPEIQWHLVAMTTASVGIQQQATAIHWCARLQDIQTYLYTIREVPTDKQGNCDIYGISMNSRRQ